MFETREFLLRARLDAASLDAWIEVGWLAPRQAGPERAFSELDLARGRLIRDLREGMGVNDEGVAIVLDLLDQVHGLRQALRRVSSALLGLPEPLRQEILTRLQGSREEVARHMGGEPLSGVG
jgi:chaperone modulatory protein CbpM